MKTEPIKPNHHGECEICLRTFDGFQVICCCGTAEEGEDVGGDGVPTPSITFTDARCTNCCGPHPKRMSGVGDWSRTDCDS